MADTLHELTAVFHDVFDDDDIVLSRATTAQDIPAWDSVMHITLMVKIERAMKLKFKSGEVAGLKNVGELVDLIDRKRA